MGRSSTARSSPSRWVDNSLRGTGPTTTKAESRTTSTSQLLEPAVWGAELAVALTGAEGRGHIYVVEPTGPFEDDPNVTNKRFPGNVTQSYRTRHPMRIVDEIESWDGHAPDVLQGMLDNLARLRDQGLDLIED